MKRTQTNKVGNKVENTNTKWVVARIHPTNDHFQFLRARKWWDWVNHPSDAAIFNSQFDASRALSVHEDFATYGGEAFVATLS